ncbi:MAG: hypothetical protein IT238_12005 [Bacteroidia bacterium]|nr:hypothetical protein [Bacteroidia bacterium]
MFIIIIYFLPYFLLGENFPIRIHDNADSNIVMAKIALEDGGFFPAPNAITYRIMNGIPISTIDSGINLYLIPFKIFGFYWGYVVNKLIVSLTAFWGMLLLLRSHIVSKEKSNLIYYGVALCFALLPFWSFNLPVAGVPLVLYVFFNRRKGIVKKTDWLLILYYLAYSSLIFTGLFLIVFIGIIGIIDLIRQKKINLHFLYAFIFLIISTILINYLLFYSFFLGEKIPSNRLEKVWMHYGIVQFLKESFIMFVKGDIHTHASSLQTIIILPLSLIALAWMIIKKQFNFLFLFILFFIAATSIFHGMEKWDRYSQIHLFLWNIVPINLRRFFTLHPPLWAVLFAFSLSIVWNKKIWSKILVSIFLVVQVVYCFLNHEFIKNKDYPTFKAFYAENQFKEVKNSINEPLNSFRVASLGLHPAITQFNGFYTLDGFVPSYSLNYRHDFKKIMEKEIEKSPALKLLYSVSSRCYLLSSELGIELLVSNPISRKKNIELNKQGIDNTSVKAISQLDYNYEQFKKMGGKYIISSVPINDSVHLNLKNTFEDEESNWTIYLYYVL